MNGANRQEVQAPAIAAIVPCRGHAGEVDACLASLERQSFGGVCEIVLVDSAADPDVARVAARHPRVRLVRSEVPLAPGLARNVGAAATSAPLLAFLDADCVAEVGWIQAAHEALLGGAVGVGGPVGDLHPWHPVAAADNMLQFYDFSDRRPPGPLAYMPSCNLAVRRDVFEALGGFPGGMTNEDVLLTRQIAKRGPERLRFAPTMRVRHQGRRSLAAFWRHQREFGRARGEYAALNSPLDARFSRFYVWLPYRVLKRLAYIATRTARWAPKVLVRFLLLLPLLVPGVVVWAFGVVEGSRRRLDARGRDPSPTARPRMGAAYPAEPKP